MSVSDGKLDTTMLHGPLGGDLIGKLPKYFPADYPLKKIKQQTGTTAKSMRITLPNNHRFNIIGYSYAGVTKGSNPMKQVYPLRISESTQLSPPAVYGDWVTLSHVLQEYDDFMVEAVGYIRKHLADNLPMWFATADDFNLKSGVSGAASDADDSLSYGFFIHPKYTSCKVWLEGKPLLKVGVDDLIDYSGGSWFNVATSSKMIDFTFNEETKQIDVTNFVNVNSLTLQDYGHDKSVQTEPHNFLAEREKAEDAKLVAELEKTAQRGKSFYLTNQKVLTDESDFGAQIPDVVPLVLKKSFAISGLKRKSDEDLNPVYKSKD